MSETFTIESEIYKEKSFENKSSLLNKNILLEICLLNTFKSTEETVVDEEGDLIIERKKHILLQIECSPSSTLQLVGLQLWRGAFVMADYILSNKLLFENKNVLELGAGVGFTSIVAGFYAKEVISTDMDEENILELIRRNFDRNKYMAQSKFTVLPLNFYNLNWSSEFQNKLRHVDIIFATDVIYDDNLSEAFLETIIKILDVPGNKKFYLTLEKRYVFTVSELNTVAPCYEYFLKILLKKSRRLPMASWKIRQIPIDFQQSFKYDRSDDLVLWEIES